MVKLNVIAGIGFAAVVAGSAKWTANVESTGGSTVSGTATIERAESKMSSEPSDSAKPMMPAASESLRASISIKGANPNSSYAWHIHNGSCAAIGTTVGPAAGYPDVQAGADGLGRASATVTEGLDTGSHVIAVHQGNAESATIACGELRPGVTP